MPSTPAPADDDQPDDQRHHTRGDVLRGRAEMLERCDRPADRRRHEEENERRERRQVDRGFSRRPRGLRSSQRRDYTQAFTVARRPSIARMGRTPLVIAAYAILSLTLGGQWIAAKLGVTAVPALELSTMRFAIAAIVLLAACAVTRTPLPLRSWRPIAAAAACGVLAFNTLAFIGISYTPASDSALIIPTTIPLATALFATLIRERLTTRKLIGFAIATMGAAIVIVGGQGAGDEASALRLRGDLMEVGA